MWVHGLEWTGPGKVQVADPFECGNEPSGSVKLDLYIRVRRREKASDLYTELCWFETKP